MTVPWRQWRWGWFTIVPMEGSPGFRLAVTDLAFIALLALLSYAMHSYSDAYHIYLLPLYLGGSFFLFCNVFRVGNLPEALWYVPFVISASVGFYFIEYFWWIVLGVCEPVKIFMIAYSMARGPYCGAFYKWVGKYNGRASD